MIPDCPGLCALYFNLFPPKIQKRVKYAGGFVHIHNFAYAIVKMRGGSAKIIPLRVNFLHMISEIIN